MNKKIIIVIVVLLLLGILALLSAPKKSPTSNQANQLSQPTQALGPTSLKDLIAKGIAQTCTFSSDSNKGTVYLSSGKMRGDFDTTIDNKVTTSHMIVDGNTSYIWIEGQNTGFKANFDTQNPQPTTTSKTMAESFDTSQSLNYDCKPSAVNTTLFTLPTDVNFMEFTGIPTTRLPSTSVSPAGESSSAQCSYCNNLQGDAKTQCRTALNCK